MPVNPQWLSQHQEEILEPELPICDPHHHLWDYPDSRYLVPELLQDTGSGHNIRSTVFVECMSAYEDSLGSALAPVGETRFVMRQTQQDYNPDHATRVADGIVGFADLRLGKSVEQVIDAHLDAAGGRLKGIRHACGWDADASIRNSHTNPPPHLYLDPDFQAGFACLQEFDLVFDAWLYHTQLEELRTLAQLFPDQTFIIDHVGGPLGIGPFAGKREEVFNQWRESMSLLAQQANVHVKLGGMAMAINGFDWHKRAHPPSSSDLAAAMAPYISHCIEEFGTARCMFESNFPVDKVSCSYAVLWNAFKRLAQDFSIAEKAQLFHDNAVRLYSLTDSSRPST